MKLKFVNRFKWHFAVGVWILVSTSLLTVAHTHAHAHAHTKVAPYYEDLCNRYLDSTVAFLNAPSQIPDREQTAFFRRTEPDGTIVFELDSPTDNFRSDYTLVPNSFTIQGDIRNPFLFFRPALSVVLGFSIQRVNGKIEIRAPNSGKLRQRVMRANRNLKAKGRDPIPYLPVRAGFLEDEAALIFVLQSEGDIIMPFPYADQDPVLVGHEVGYHLGALAYPRKLVERAAMITRHTHQFINYLRLNGEKLGNVREEIIKGLYRDRFYELDAGTSDVPICFAYMAIGNDAYSFRDIWHANLENPEFASSINGVVQGVDYFARPGMTPLEALVNRINYMTGLDLPVSPGHAEFQVYRNIFTKHGGRVTLSPAENEALRKIVQNYVREHRHDDGDVEISTPEEWANQLANGLDQRLSEILAAVTAP